MFTTTPSPSPTRPRITADVVALGTIGTRQCDIDKLIRKLEAKGPRSRSRTRRGRATETAIDQNNA